MADLAETQQSEVTRITNGDETSIVGVSNSGEIQSRDTIKSGGVFGAITVGTTAIEAKVGASKLTNRKSLTVYNNSNKNIYWGFTDSVTIANGTTLGTNELLSISLESDVSVWLIADNAGLDVRITEAP